MLILHYLHRVYNLLQLPIFYLFVIPLHLDGIIRKSLVVLRLQLDELLKLLNLLLKQGFYLLDHYFALLLEIKLVFVLLNLAYTFFKYSYLIREGLAGGEAVELLIRDHLQRLKQV